MYYPQKNYITRVGKVTGQAQIYLGPQRPEVSKKTISRGTVYVMILAAVVAASIVLTALIGAEAEDGVCWILCKPGAQVNVRRTPDKNGQIVGWLEVGDEIRTDGESRNGFIRVYGVGEEPEAWVYSGFVATEKPIAVYETYSCVARNRVACRRWVNGPRISGKTGWMYNGTTVQVFYLAGEWAVTSRGYIASEWLEVAPL